MLQRQNKETTECNRPDELNSFYYAGCEGEKGKEKELNGPARDLRR